MKSFPKHLLLPLSLLLLLLILFFYFFHKSTSMYHIPHQEPSHFKTIPIPIYFINLQSSHDRYQKITEQCSSPQSCIRIDAIDGSTLDRDNLPLQLHKKNMRDNTIACFLSHCKALQTFLKSNHPYGIILEDDVTFPKNLVDQIKERIYESKTFDFDLFYLGATRMCGKPISSHVLKTKQVHKNCNAGTFAYMVSQRGAKMILDQIEKNGIQQMFDHQIRDYFPHLQVYSMNPALVQHDFDVPSVRLNISYPDSYIQVSKSVTTS